MRVKESTVRGAVYIPTLLYSIPLVCTCCAFIIDQFSDDVVRTTRRASHSYRITRAVTLGRVLFSGARFMLSLDRFYHLLLIIIKNNSDSSLQRNLSVHKL